MKSVLISAGYDVTGFNRSNIDLSLSEEKLATQLHEFDVVINAVTYTALDQSYLEPELANQINGEIAGKLDRWKIAEPKIIESVQKSM